MAAPRRAASIPFDQFTEQTLSAVLRAVEAQKLPQRPIIIGIIWNPQGLPGFQGVGGRGAAGKEG